MNLCEASPLLERVSPLKFSCTRVSFFSLSNVCYMQNHTSFVVVEQNPVMHEEIKCSLHCILLQRLLLSTILYCSAPLSQSASSKEC